MDSCLNCGHSTYKEGETRLKTMANFKCNWEEKLIRPHWKQETTVITIQSNQPFINCPAFIERKDQIMGKLHPLTELMTMTEYPFKDCGPAKDSRERQFRGMVNGLRDNFWDNLIKKIQSETKRKE